MLKSSLPDPEIACPTSNAATVELKHERSRIPLVSYIRVVEKIHLLIADKDVPDDNLPSLRELVIFCKKREILPRRFIPLLKRYGLLDSKGKVPPVVRSVVLSSMSVVDGTIKFDCAVTETCADDDDVLFEHQLLVKASGILGLQLGLYAARKTLGRQKITTFCKKTPNGKALWESYLEHRPPVSKYDPEVPQYSLVDYIKDVVAGKIETELVAA